MASRTALLILITAAMAVAVMGAPLPANAACAHPTIFKVGDDSGWNLGVDYGAWASSKEFHCGNQIEFVYPKGSHNVVVVDKASYDACTVPSGAVPLDSGDDLVTFGSDQAQMFFICGFEGHCQSGMKLAVDIHCAPM